LLERFGRIMRENFASGSIPLRKAYMQSLVSVVEVDDTTVRIKAAGIFSKGRSGQPNGAVPGSQMSTEWRSLGESNPCFSLERAAS
jgi:site-specific DNA recombinase